MVGGLVWLQEKSLKNICLKEIGLRVKKLVTILVDKLRGTYMDEKLHVWSGLAKVVLPKMVTDLARMSGLKFMQYYWKME